MLGDQFIIVIEVSIQFVAYWDTKQVSKYGNTRLYWSVTM